MKAWITELAQRLETVPPEREAPVAHALTAFMDVFLPTATRPHEDVAGEPLHIDLMKGEARRGDRVIGAFNSDTVPWRLFAQFLEYTTIHVLSIVCCGLKGDSKPLHRFYTVIGELSKCIRHWGVVVEFRRTDVPGMYRMVVKSSHPYTAPLVSNVTEAQRIALLVQNASRDIIVSQSTKAVAQLRHAFTLDPNSFAVSTAVNACAGIVAKHDRLLLQQAWAIAADRKRRAMQNLLRIRRCAPDPDSHDREWEAVSEFMDRINERISLCHDTEQHLEAVCVESGCMDADLVALNAILNKAAVVAITIRSNEDQAERDLNSILGTEIVQQLISHAAMGEAISSRVSHGIRLDVARAAVRALILAGRFHASPIRLNASSMKDHLLILVLKEMRELFSRKKEDRKGRRERPAGRRADWLKKDLGEAAVTDSESDGDGIERQAQEDEPVPDEPNDADDYEYRQDMTASGGDE